MGLELEVTDLHHKKAVSFCDNTPVVSLVTCMASKHIRISGCLVKNILFRAMERQMCLLEALGTSNANKMVDVMIRSFNAKSGCLFSNNELLSHFRSNFPLPQNRGIRAEDVASHSLRAGGRWP